MLHLLHDDFVVGEHHHANTRKFFAGQSGYETGKSGTQRGNALGETCLSTTQVVKEIPPHRDEQQQQDHEQNHRHRSLLRHQAIIPQAKPVSVEIRRQYREDKEKVTRRYGDVSRVKPLGTLQCPRYSQARLDLQLRVIPQAWPALSHRRYDALWTVRIKTTC
jgi:hypothetical protein